MLGGALLGRAAKKKPNTLAPGPTNAADGVEPVGTPEPPVVDPGQQQAAAQVAGGKQRKRAALGSLLTNPKAPASSTMPVAPRYATRSLLGS